MQRNNYSKGDIETIVRRLCKTPPASRVWVEKKHGDVMFWRTTRTWRTGMDRSRLQGLETSDCIVFVHETPKPHILSAASKPWLWPEGIVTCDSVENFLRKGVRGEATYNNRTWHNQGMHNVNLNELTSICTATELYRLIHEMKSEQPDGRAA